MNRLIRFFNRNFRKIYTSIAIICITIFMLTNIDKGVKNAKENNRINDRGSDNTSSISTNLSDGEELSKEEYSHFEDTVKAFVQHCNLGEVQDAYDLLTEECKINLYETREKFEENYIKDYFNNIQEYKLFPYDKNIYKIQYTEEMMSSGKTKNLEKKIDYIVFNKNNNKDYKININSFVESAKINRKISQSNIEIVVEKLLRFIEYDEYLIKIVNNTEKDIQMKKEDIYILSDNEKFNIQNLKEDIYVSSKKESYYKIRFLNKRKIREEMKKVLYIDKIQTKNDTYIDNLEIEI